MSTPTLRFPFLLSNDTTRKAFAGASVRDATHDAYFTRPIPFHGYNIRWEQGGRLRTAAIPAPAFLIFFEFRCEGGLYLSRGGSA